MPNKWKYLPLILIPAALFLFETPLSQAKKVKTKLSLPSAIASKNSKTKSADSASALPIKMDSISFEEVKPSIEFSGFDKPISSKKETFLITNNSARDLAGLLIDITYTDLEGRMITRKNHLLTITIPAGETTMAEIPTFDIQKSMYYKRSTPPSGNRPATPFDVRINLLELYTSNLPEE